MSSTSKFVLPYHELQFETARSSGAGGQHVNRTESAVLLRWNVRHSPSLTDEVRYKLMTRLRTWITTEGDLLIKSQEHRSQKQNKDTCIEKLLNLVEKAFIEPKKRVKTKPTRSSQRKRLEGKKKHSEVKQNRMKVKA